MNSEKKNIEVVMAYRALAGADKRKVTTLAKQALEQMGVEPAPSLVALHRWRREGGVGRNGINRFYGPAYRTALARFRASKLAEAGNIEAHDEYLRETRPELMEGGYVNS